jgi:hypothetical protein
VSMTTTTAVTTDTPERAAGPRPWVRDMIAVQLRIGLGVCLLNGGLLGYLSARQGTSSSALAWSTLLGPAAVAGVLENDLLIPFIQIGLGLALIVGFFTVISAIIAGFLILSAPIFQFLAILSSSNSAGNPGNMVGANLPMQVLVSTGSINLLLLVASVLWLTPFEGTSWSLDALIFAHLRNGPADEPDRADAMSPPLDAAPARAGDEARPEPAADLSATPGERSGRASTA